MFVRTSSRRNKDGSQVRYLQLAHNTWDPVAKTSRMKVLYNFGRAEDVEQYMGVVYNFVSWLQETLMNALLKTLPPR